MEQLQGKGKTLSKSEEILSEIRKTVDDLERKLKPILFQTLKVETKEASSSSNLVRQLEDLSGNLNQLTDRIDL